MYEPIRNKNRQWRPCFLSDWDEMRKLYKEPSIDAPYQILINLAKQFQRRFLMYQPIRNKNRPWRPCLLTDPNQMSKLEKVSEEKIFNVSVNQKQESSMAAMFFVRSG